MSAPSLEVVLALARDHTNVRLLAGWAAVFDL